MVGIRLLHSHALGPVHARGMYHYILVLQVSIFPSHHCVVVVFDVHAYISGTFPGGSSSDNTSTSWRGVDQGNKRQKGKVAFWATVP